MYEVHSLINIALVLDVLYMAYVLYVVYVLYMIMYCMWYIYIYCMWYIYTGCGIYTVCVWYMCCMCVIYVLYVCGICIVCGRHTLTYICVLSRKQNQARFWFPSFIAKQVSSYKNTCFTIKLLWLIRYAKSYPLLSASLNSLLAIDW